MDVTVYIDPSETIACGARVLLLRLQVADFSQLSSHLLAVTCSNRVARHRGQKLSPKTRMRTGPKEA